MFAKKKGLSMGKILSAALALYALFISNSTTAKNMDSLTANEKNIVRAAAFAAKGDQTGLKSALSAGLIRACRRANTKRCSCSSTRTADFRAV